LHGDLREMENQNSLSAYMITDKTPIFLENTQTSNRLTSEVADNPEFQTTVDVRNLSIHCLGS